VGEAVPLELIAGEFVEFLEGLVDLGAVFAGGRCFVGFRDFFAFGAADGDEGETEHE